LTDHEIVDSSTPGGLEERTGAVEGGLATLNGGELDAVPDGVHERREPRCGLADTRVVEAHDLAAARRVAGVLVLAVVPVVVPGRPPAAVTLVVTVVVIVAVPGLNKVLLVSSRIVELLPRQPRAPRSRDERPQAARLVCQVELRPAEHLRAHRQRELCQDDSS
jgi:hypothetical protein